MENSEVKHQKIDVKPDFGPIFLGIIIFSATFILSAYLVSNAILNLRSDRTITVRGLAEMDITSDFATWTATFFTTAPTLAEGHTRMVALKKRIENYLIENGFSKDSIEFQTLGSHEHIEFMRDGSSRSRGQRFHQNFTINSHDVYKIRDISQKITELMSEGIEINSWQPQYSYTGLNDLRIIMLSEATKDAKARAEEMAKSSGNKIGSILSASQGVFQITAVNSNEIADYGINDRSSIEKTMQSVVTVRYAVK